MQNLSRAFAVCAVVTLLLTESCTAENVVIRDEFDLIDFASASYQASVFDDDVVVEKDLVLLLFSISKPLGLHDDGTCVPFSGTFDGKGHTIDYVSLNSADADSSLFCALENATIKNVVIGKNSAFSGVKASAVAVTARGTVLFQNVATYAKVTGNYSQAGFISEIYGENGVNITITNCLNAGDIVGVYHNNATDSLGSGFISHVMNDIGSNITITDSINKGNVESFLTKNNTFGGLGGFISGIYASNQTNVLIKNCVNDGNIISHTPRGKISGFVGYFFGCDDIVVNLIDVVNNGDVDLTATTDDGFAGGMVGYVGQMNPGKLNVINGTNNGEVKATVSHGIAGIVGRLYARKQFNVSASFKHCANNGNVVANSLQTCGLFCTPDVLIDREGITTSVENCINKGIVVGRKCWGISCTVTSAKNVVSMGTVQGTNKSYSLWETATSSSSVFGLERSCVNCDDSVIKFRQGSDKVYSTSSDGQRVDYLLNQIVKSEQYGIGWNRALDLGVVTPKSPYAIRSFEDFERLYTAYFEGFAPSNPIDVVLETDLDFSKWENAKPFGYGVDNLCTPFTGSFDGKGHSISNLVTANAFFCKLQNAVVKDLTLEESCVFGSSSVMYAAGLSLSGAGKLVFNGVTNKASVHAYSEAAGFILRYTDDNSLTFINCINEGSVVGDTDRSFGFTFGGSKSFFINSINKGEIKGPVAYGLALVAGVADNVVNLGNITAVQQYNAFCLFAQTSFKLSVFGLSSSCKGCSDAFSDTFYNPIEEKEKHYSLEDGTLVNTILNKNSEKYGYGMQWSKRLIPNSSNCFDE